MYNFEPILIKSHKWEYTVNFNNMIDGINKYNDPKYFFIIDKNIYNIYYEKIPISIQNKFDEGLKIEANEVSKSLEFVPEYVNELVMNKVRRGGTLVAIGGGVIQDITCFLASIFLRGIDWVFIPTTLLAQADSCIGSKSSINVGTTKNIVGTFYPPKEIMISPDYLDSLCEDEMRSGIGEIIKIYGLSEQSKLRKLINDFEYLTSDRELLLNYIFNSLNIKKKIIEEDEFDRSSRLVLNYGHSFGHAIESSTNYLIPHGIAVSMGCHFANYISKCLKINSGDKFNEMSKILVRNFKKYKGFKVEFKNFMNALMKDKKNVGNDLVLILPDKYGELKVTQLSANDDFNFHCKEFLYKELDFI